MSLLQLYPDEYYMMDIYDEDWNIGCLIDVFINNSHSFEWFCAELFSNMGYKNIGVTSATHDGGYDVKMDDGMNTYLVECKCYKQENMVGRPILQKLVGANAVIHAEKLIVVTTSCFSEYARNYADNLGIILIDGVMLESLIRHHISI